MSLFAGLVVGSLILSGGNPITATVNLLETQLWQTVIQPDKLRVFAFSMMLSAMIGVIQVSGGMRGMVELLTPWARSRRSGQIVTWLLGMIVFFDDYANCLLIGGTMQPTCDRLRISREKLSFLVDATAAPVAGIAIVSTWIAIEFDYIREGIASLDPHLAAGLNPFDLFVACIPYRFYVIQMLLFLPLMALLKRDFGPMLAAERRAAAGEQAVLGDRRLHHRSLRRRPGSSRLALDERRAAAGRDARGFALADLRDRCGTNHVGCDSAHRVSHTFAPRSARAIRASPSTTAPSPVCSLAVVLARWRVGVAAKRVAGAAGLGARMVLPALAILVLAGAMSRMTGNKAVDGAPSARPYEYQADRLYTGDYMKQILVSVSHGATHDFAVWFPTIVFLLACVISFLHRYELWDDGHFGADGDSARGEP